MNKRQRKKALKKRIGPEKYKELDKRVDDIFRAYANALGESCEKYVNNLLNE